MLPASWFTITGSQGVWHASCKAHHLRELKALVEIEKEEWASKMQRLLRRACHVTNRARDRGIPMKPRFIEAFERHYDTIIAEGFLFHEAQAPLVRTMIKGGSKPRTPRRPHSACRERVAFLTRAVLICRDV
jgi:transposase